MVKLSEDEVYLIGGNQHPKSNDSNCCSTNQVWIINPQNGFSVKEGPPMKEPRRNFACGIFQDPFGNKKIVVAGGDESTDDIGKDSVEILNPVRSTNKWYYGKCLKILIWKKYFEYRAPY